MSPDTLDAYRAAARRLHRDPGVIEIDDDAPVSISEDDDNPDGAYVQAWIWIDRTDTDIEEEQ